MANKRVVFGLEAQDNATPKLKQAAAAADALAAKLKALDGAGSLQGLRRNLIASVNDLRAASSAVSSIPVAAIARAHGVSTAPAPVDSTYGVRSAAAAGWATKNPWVGTDTKEIWGRFAKEQVAEAKAAFASLGQSVAANKLAIAGWGTAVALAGKAALDAAIRMDRLEQAYTTVTGSSVLAERQLDFVRQKSHELGLEFFSTAEASKNFFAAMKGTSIEKDANDIFEAVSMAATALSLSEQDVEGTFRALGQMISKGKVQAEELRGQLGERLPGAFQFAAKAMGMTTMELDKALERGNVLADEMLPKLAVVLRDEFGEAAMKAAGGLQQGLNRVNTEWERFKASVLDSETVSAVLAGISSTLKQFNDLSDKNDRDRRTDAEMRAARVVPLGLRQIQKAGHWGEDQSYWVAEYTEEQRENWRKLRQEVAGYNESIVSTQTAVEKTLSNASRTVKNYLKDTEESRRTSLQHEYDNVVATIDKAIEARKQEGRDYADLVADRARVDAEYARKRTALDSKYRPKGEGSGIVDHAGKAIAELRAKQARAEKRDYKQETRDLDLVADAMRELEQKSGQYGLSVEYVNQLIERQAELWRAAGVPEEYIKQLKEMRRLEASTKGWDGARLAAQEYFTSTQDMAEGWGGVVTGAFQSMEDSITQACMTGRLSFSDMVNSMLADIMRLMVRQSVTGPLAGALGQGIGNLFAVPNGYNFTAQLNGFSSANPAVDFYAGMGLHNGGVVGKDSPSFIRYVPSALFAGAPRLHGGTGYVKPGEYPAILKAGERVLNPAETRAYQSRREPVVNVNIVNSTGQQASTRTRSDNHGNKTIDVYVGDMAAKQMATPGSTLNRAVSAQTGTRRPAIRR